jgi:hypothetical protein
LFLISIESGIKNLHLVSKYNDGDFYRI